MVEEEWEGVGGTFRLLVVTNTIIIVSVTLNWNLGAPLPRPLTYDILFPPSYMRRTEFPIVCANQLVFPPRVINTGVVSVVEE